MQYLVVAHKPNGETLYRTGRKFSAIQANGLRLDSIDFAALTGKMEQESHPDWKVKLRIYEDNEFADECGPLPNCRRCGLALTVCECDGFSR